MVDRAVEPWKNRVQKLERQLAEEKQNQAKEREDWQGRLLRAEVRAAASGKLQQVDDAERYLDLSGFRPDSKGGFDHGAIETAIEGLIRERPYLMPKAQVPAPLPGNGPQEPTPAPPPDMNTMIRRATGR